MDTQIVLTSIESILSHIQRGELTYSPDVGNVPLRSPNVRWWNDSIARPDEVARSRSFRRLVIQKLLRREPLQIPPLVAWKDPPEGLKAERYRPTQWKLSHPLLREKAARPTYVLGGTDLFLVLYHLHDWSDLWVQHNPRTREVDVVELTAPLKVPDPTDVYPCGVHWSDLVKGAYHEGYGRGASAEFETSYDFFWRMARTRLPVLEVEADAKTPEQVTSFLYRMREMEPLTV